MRVIIFCVVLTVLAVFIRTAPPTVYMGDSGELAVAGHTLGIGHPPGYPLYTMALKVISLAPAGDIAFRMNLGAVIFAVLVMVMFYMNACLLLKNTGKRNAPASNYIALAVAAAFVCSNIFWFESIIIKGGIYTMECFFVLAVLYCVLKYTRRQGKGYLYLGFYLSGFLPAVHNTSMIACFFALVIMSAASNREKFIVRAAAWALFLIPVLTSYLYLFIRAQSAEIRWGDIRTAEEVFNHIIRLQYMNQDLLPFTVRAFFFKLGNYIVEYLKNYNVLALFSVLGIWALFKDKSRPGAVLGLFFVINLLGIFFFTWNNPSPIDIYGNKAYYLVNDMTLLLASTFGLGWSLKTLKPQVVPPPALLLLPVAFLSFNFTVNDHEKAFLAYDHADNIYKSVENGDIIFAKEDVDIFNMQYARYVLDKFSGVRVYDVNGNIFDLSYLRPAMGNGGFNRQKQEAFEARAFETNPGKVYYTEEKTPEEHDLFPEPYGILNKPVKWGQRQESAESLMRVYSIRDFFNTNNSDYVYRMVEGRYFVRRAEYAAIRGDGKGFEFWKQAAESIAGDAPGVLKAIAMIYYKNAHDMKNCVVYLEKSAALDPFDFGVINLITYIYTGLQMYTDALKWAEIYYDREWDAGRKKMILSQMEYIRGKQAGAHE